ncbi:MAG TPA: hypothetical protein VFF67_10630 [Thermoplasmata archaeon]|nr:hypothetical protein [Thermoplasmata archaeon]
MSAPSYVWGPAPAPVQRITTSRTEILHLLIAYLVLTVDIAILREGVGFGVPTGFALSQLPFDLGLGAAVAATGFVAHELAHKIVAQRYGFWAEFRMSPIGLLVSVMTSFVGFLMALPGATVIGGLGDEREWGRTSLAGPVLNLVEGTVFFALAWVAWFVALAPTAAIFLLLLALFNGVFASFNLIPLGLLDGRKVFRWNKAVWAVSFAGALVFTGWMFATFYLPTPPPPFS